MMLITTAGTVIRIAVKDTALSGRITSGVKLIDLDDGVDVASIAKVRKDDKIESDIENDSQENSDEGSDKDPDEDSNENPVE